MDVKELINLIRYDFYRNTGGKSGLPSFIVAYMFVPSVRYLFWLRLAQYYKNRIILFKMIRLLLKRYSYKFGYQIHPLAEIGKGLHLRYIGMILVNPGAKLGNNVNIQAGAIIGQVNRGKHLGCPVIGDNVWIGAYAVIVGNITIGNNVLIAPNSFVTESIPDNAVVSGNPAKIINFSGTKGYIENEV